MITEFFTPTKIILGEGAINRTGEIVKSVGNNGLIVSSHSGRYNSKLEKQLLEKDVRYCIYKVSGEPTVETVLQGLQIARQNKVEVVVGIGGGSTLDTAKAIAILMTNSGDIYNYLEVVGEGKVFQNRGLPSIAIPTTAGTGTEVTKNAVISVPNAKVKVSLRSEWMIPKMAIIDPELTYCLEQEVTAFSGMDALTQLIEPYVCNQPNPVTDPLCRDGIMRIANNFQTAYYDGTNKKARYNMSVASLFSGMALANAKLGAVHGFAGVLGGMYGTPHGEICAILLPQVIKVNLDIIKNREPNNAALTRYRQIAKMILNSEDEQELIEWILDLDRKFSIPTLRSIGIRREDFNVIIEKASQANSMKGNPINLSEKELQTILEYAY